MRIQFRHFMDLPGKLPDPESVELPGKGSSRLFSPSRGQNRGHTQHWMWNHWNKANAVKLRGVAALTSVLRRMGDTLYGMEVGPKAILDHPVCHARGCAEDATVAFHPQSDGVFSLCKCIFVFLRGPKDYGYSTSNKIEKSSLWALYSVYKHTRTFSMLFSVLKFRWELR